MQLLWCAVCGARWLLCECVARQEEEEEENNSPRRSTQPWIGNDPSRLICNCCCCCTYVHIPVCMTKAATDYFDRFHSTHFNNNINKNIDDAIILSLYSSNQSPFISVSTLIVHLQGDRQTPHYRINRSISSNESCSRSDLDSAIRCRIKLIFHSAEPPILLDDQL